MKKRLGVAVAAMLLGAQMGSPAAVEERDVERLQTISQLISAGDIEALVVYLAENPELMEGEDAVALRLRQFMAAAENMAAYLAFDPPMRTALARQIADQNPDELQLAIY